MNLSRPVVSCRFGAVISFAVALLGDPGLGSAQPIPAQPPPSVPAAPPPANSPLASPTQPDFLSALFGPPGEDAIRRRLARAPDMFGDIYIPGGTLTATAIARPQLFIVTTSADMPAAGGGGRLKVGENNKALPVDRVFFNFNHYHNAVEHKLLVTGPGGTFRVSRDLPLDRYTFGVEKTFFDGDASIELRMPLTGYRDYDVASPNQPGAPLFSSESGDTGNLSILLKAVLGGDETTVWSAGLGIETPTGSDAEVFLISTRYRVHNEAVHLHPFLAVLATPDERVTFNAFAQLDFATEGNRVTFRDSSGAAGSLGDLTPQTLLHLDASLAYWVYRSECSSVLTGVAPMVEIHYVTALEDSDRVAGTLVFPQNAANVQLRNRAGRFDAVHLTAGVHLEIARDAALRVAGVFPLRGRENRFFDSEVLAQLTLRF